MANRSNGFLGQKERRYLSEIDCYPGTIDDDGEYGRNQAKSRVKNDVATASGISEALKQFDKDLCAINRLHLQSQEGDSQYWKMVHLTSIEQDLKSVRKTVDMMLEIAGGEEEWNAREELREAISILHPGEVHPENGYVAAREEQMELVSEADGDITFSDLEEMYLSYKTRWEGLQSILTKEGLPEILEYIGKNGWCSLGEKRVGQGEYWATISSRELVPDLAQKREEQAHPREYNLTEDGKVVLECWQALKDTDAVEMKQFSNESSERKLVLRSLEDFFDLDTFAPY